MGYVIIKDSTITRQDSIQTIQQKTQQNRTEFKLMRILKKMEKLQSKMNIKCIEELEKLLQQEEAKLDSLRNAIETERVVKQEISTMQEQIKTEIYEEAKKFVPKFSLK